jgi:DNA polymerase I-like protein with 3'-5' exonuclease and polymerase domains
MRPMIKPPRGYGVAYLDAAAQEYLINGTLSGEPRIISDYLTSNGDVHERLAAELGLSEMHGQKPRYRAKIINHATNYGQGAQGLAGRLGISEDAAAAILQEHARVRPVFYRWRQSIIWLERLN